MLIVLLGECSMFVELNEGFGHSHGRKIEDASANGSHSSEMEVIVAIGEAR